MSITLWKPEPDVLIHQALGKLVEELGELTQIAARCIIQGFDASEPVTGISNRQQLQKEMSDVLAALEWASELTGVSEDTDRLMTKLDGFRRWQRMLEEDMQSKPCGIADPSTRDCANMKEVGGGMDGERYRCGVCGKGYFLDYEDMK
ncbi:hypothetical protein [Rhizobium rhizogenes]|uniref:hypothetical protein n=1 Tax=Rhizobium rhizogenes TaxID=359 RepID=UPI001574E8E1|nr:hypothetical protein [Rhizobium rhizogenes]